LVNSAEILSELKVDDKVITACLLHDVLEDTKVTKKDLEKEFGAEISDLVEGVTKISKLKITDSKIRQIESIRKMLLATTEDIRVIIIKLADRLDNVKSLNYFNKEKQKRIARETLDIYVPIAYRLGLSKIKWQLEDLAFRYLNPELYQDFKDKVAKKRHEREIEINKIKSSIEKELKKHNIQAEISGRPKNFYSIYKKMLTKNREFEQIYDLIALRIIVKNINECYEVLGVIHNMFKPITQEFEDYIANPKSNMYQSLHTVVLTPEGRNIEFQIRTKEMHNIAEEGIAAHWQYKGLSGDYKFDKKLSWLKEILNLKDEETNTFLEALKLDLFSESIFVFTPKGDIIELPKDSTPVDFAYAVHTDIGNKCIGARVNDKFVNLKSTLKNGDIIEIITSKNHFPSRDWLKFVKSARAKSKILQTLRLIQNIPIKNIKKFEKEENIIESEVDARSIKLAECCNPLPLDEISGLISKGNKITVHKTDCQNSINDRKVNVSWNDSSELLVKLKIIAEDRVGLLAEILNSISSLGVHMEKAEAHISGKDIAECNLNFKFDNIKELKEIIERIKKIRDVKKVSIN
jgi:GTP pyrophosphokinase